MHWDRKELYDRIDDRVDEMIKAGLEKEALEFNNSRNLYALRSVGYTEFFDYFDGRQNLVKTIDLIKQHTRNFAKRQITWFKRDRNVKWVGANDENAIFAFVKSKIQE